MSAGDLEINLIATDNASDTINSVSSSMSTLTSESEDSGMSLSRTFSAAGRVAASSVIAFDRYSIASTAVENANMRVSLAQDNLTHAIERYGPASREAQRAHDELAISTRGVEIAQQRLEVRMLMGGLIVMPRMIEGIQKLGTQLKDLITIQDAETLATEVNTRAKLANIAVTTFGLGLAVALPALMIAQSVSAGPAIPNLSSTNISHYGDINVQGVQTPSDFAHQYSNQAQIRVSRATRP